MFVCWYFFIIQVFISFIRFFVNTNLTSLKLRKNKLNTNFINYQTLSTTNNIDNQTHVLNTTTNDKETYLSNSTPINNQNSRTLLIGVFTVINIIPRSLQNSTEDH